MGRSSNSSQALLDLENSTQNSSSKESALLVCKRGDEDLLKKLEAAKTKANGPPDSKPAIAAPPPSQVMGKVRDFLGVMAESNKKLQLDAMNSKNYDIEALTGDESEYIEMDLMLGVADLHTPAAFEIHDDVKRKCDNSWFCTGYAQCDNIRKEVEFHNYCSLLVIITVYA
ncbi:hypothetical protein Ccrd_021463 [Cynara cardunculus var. scolymus]|uniref:Uncharacterized protein n=1 Tax=Cynara cardunculus var. scolymus TaxID=59895 RepID=A0A103Y0N9_CYNCS|nr:hypothetical protein Ccrd_021463 [Cynara cardunculus var. scolymus]